jgi:hypothetical protein
MVESIFGEILIADGVDIISESDSDSRESGSKLNPKCISKIQI